MNYRVHFTTGQSILLDKEIFTSDFIGFVNNPIGFYINPQHITHIVTEPEDNTATGVANTPSPEDLRTQRNRDKEELLKDPKMIIRRAIEKKEGVE